MAETVEPWDTIGTVIMAVLIIAYLVAAPTTVIIAVVELVARARALRAAVAPGPYSAPPAPPPPAGPSPPLPPARAEPAGGAPTAPGLPPSPVSPALLRLHTLERQVLALREAPVPPATAARLAAACAELAARSGAGSTVGRYASGLLAVVEALGPADLPLADPPHPPPVAPAGPPDRVRVALARYALAGHPIPPGWAFAWLGHLPDRWPGSIRPDDLAATFTGRYRQAYPHGGLILAVGAERLTLRYLPAGARFGGRPLAVATDLPDVADQPDPVRRLRALADLSVAELWAAGFR